MKIYKLYDNWYIANCKVGERFCVGSGKTFYQALVNCLLYIEATK